MQKTYTAAAAAAIVAAAEDEAEEDGGQKRQDAKKKLWAKKDHHHRRRNKRFALNVNVSRSLPVHLIRRVLRVFAHSLIPKHFFFWTYSQTFCRWNAIVNRPRIKRNNFSNLVGHNSSKLNANVNFGKFHLKSITKNSSVTIHRGRGRTYLPNHHRLKANETKMDYKFTVMSAVMQWYVQTHFIVSPRGQDFSFISIVF